VRRAFVMAVDRGAVLQSVFGGGDLAQVPPGPIPQLWPLWNIGIRTLPYDTAQAGRLLAARGWRDANGDGIRDRAGKKLGFDILVPTTSGMRRQYARLLQEQLRRVGVEVSISEVEFNVMQDRLAKGNFDAAILTYTGDPTPSSGEPQHWRRGAAANYGHYASPPFDAALDRAISGSADTAATTAAWRDALSTLNEDAPAIFLFAMSNAAAINHRVADVRIRPDSWWALVRTWRIPADRLIDRDRVEH